MFKSKSHETPFSRESRQKRIMGCKAKLENIGWCWQSDLRQEEVNDIVEAWRQEDDGRRRMGLKVTEYGIRKAQMSGLDIWEAYII